MSTGAMLKENCLEFCDRRKIIIAEEENKKYIGNNSAKKLFSKYRVDNCIIKSGRKCDYLLINGEEKIVYLVELKGGDLISAIEQIYSTIDILQAELIEHTINARIVLSKVTTPDLRNSKYIKLERKLKQNNGTIQKGTRVLEEKL